MPTAIPRPQPTWAHPLLDALSVFAPSANEPEPRPGPLASGAAPPPSDATGRVRPTAPPADPGAGQGDLLAAILSVGPPGTCAPDGTTTAPARP